MAVIVYYRFKRKIDQIDELIVISHPGGKLRLIPNVAVGQLKPGFFVIVLLGKDAIQTDIAACQPFHCGLPEYPAVSPAAEFGLDDIETDKTEALPISHR